MREYGKQLPTFKDRVMFIFHKSFYLLFLLKYKLLYNISFPLQQMIFVFSLSALLHSI